MVEPHVKCPDCKEEMLAELRGLVWKWFVAVVRRDKNVRLRPDRACMAAFKKTKAPDQGIEELFRNDGISYRPVAEFETVFMEYDNWSAR